MVVEAGAVRQRVREAAAEHDRHFPLSLGAEGTLGDISVPVSRVVEFLRGAELAVRAEAPGCRLNTFGHMGDGNIHYIVLPPAGVAAEVFLEQANAIQTAIYELALSFGGSYSAEHGIGSLKRDDFERYEKPERLVFMRAIKGVIDPNGLMNPGKVVG